MVKTDDVIQTTNTTAAGSTTTGAVVVAGGIGVGGGLYIGGNILPSVANSQDLGSATLPFRTLYLSTNTLVLGTAQLGATADGSLSSPAISVTGTNSVSSTVTGALQVAGGAGVGGGLYVGGTVTATILRTPATSIALGASAGVGQGTGAIAIGDSAGLQAQGGSGVAIGKNSGAYGQGVYSVAIGYAAGQNNQPANSIILNASATILNGANSGLYINPIRSDATTSATTWIMYYNPVTKEITTASTSTLITTSVNLAGGLQGQIAYQTASGTTAFINSGTTGQFLQATTNGAPAFTSTGSMYVNAAVSSQNIFGGAANQIPYQSAAGVTTFNSGLTFNGTTFTANNIIVPGTTNAVSTTTGALQVAGGVGIGGSLYIGGIVTATNFFIGGYAVSTSTAFSGGTVANAINITNTSPTSSSSTGALTVAGGVGIGGGLFVKGSISADTITVNGFSVSTASSLTVQSGGVSQGTVSTINFSTGLSAIASSNIATVTLTTSTLMTTAVNLAGNGAGNGALVYQSSLNTTAFLGQGSAGWLLVSGGAGSIPAFTSTGSIYVNGAVNANNIASGVKDQIPYQSAAGTTAFGSGLTFNGTTFTATNIIVPGTTNSTSTNTGALQVAGGVGIGGALYVGGVITATNIYVNGYAVSTGSSTSGALATTATNIASGAANQIPYQSAAGVTTFNSGLTFNGTTFTANNIIVPGTTNAVSTTTGALQVAGGLAIGKDLYVGGTLYIAGAGGSDIDMTGGDISNVGNLTGNTATIARVVITATTGVYSTNTGVLQVAGGVGIAGGIFAGGIVTATTFVGSIAGSNITNTSTLQVGYAANLLSGGTGSLPYQSAANTTAFLSLSGTQKSLLTAGASAPVYVTQVQATSGTGSSSGSSGQSLLVTSGGLGVTGDSYFVNNLGIGGTLVVGGDTTFSGQVTFNGTATNVLSSNTYYTDNLLEIHVPPSGVYGKWTVDDGKDVGFRFHYFTNSTDTNAALVIDNTNKYLNWYSAGAESTSSVFTSSTYGTFRTGNIILTNATGSASTQTGALTVVGGVGIGGGMVVGGIVTATTFVGNLSGTTTTATNATNIAGGVKDQIPYQTSTGTTAFSSGLTYNGTTFTATNIFVPGVTNAVSTTTGAVQVAGGLAVGKDLYVGGTLYIAGAGGSDIDMTGGDISNIGNLTANTATITRFVITATTGVYSTNTGVLQIAGGVGVAGGIFAGGIITATNFFVGGYAVSTSTAFSGGNIANSVNITSTASSTSTTTGALTVVGGVGIGGGLVVGGIITATSIIVNGTQVTPTSIQEFSATAGQTTFTIAGGYTVGQVQVTANGVTLGTGDFTASNGSTIVLNQARNLNDIIRVVVSQGYAVSAQQAYTFNQYTATASQTTFTTSYNTATVQVFANGSLVSPTAYTATNGTSIVFGSGRTAGDIIAVISFNSVSITNAISSSGGTINGTLNVTGSLQQGGMDVKSYATAMSVAMGL